MIRRAVTLDDAPELAALHSLCFGGEAWSVDQILGSLALSTTQGALLAQEGEIVAFYLIQCVQGETEILTLCVAPAQRRGGLGEELLRDLVAQCEDGTVFLEVAADNVAAKGLYTHCGFVLFGRRPAYYEREAGKVDALTYRYLVNDKP